MFLAAQLSPWIRTAVLAAGLCALPANRLAAAPQHPVPLRTPRASTPIETAGTGLAPEVAVRIHVDERGRVARVEVLSVRPSTEFDDLFREAAQTALARWRYAPARHEGRAVAAEIEWTIQFPPRESAPPEEPFGPQPWLGHVDTTVRDDLWREILALPLEQRRRMLEQIVTRAREHFKPKQLKRFEAGPFVVLTDSPSAETATTLARNLEAAYAAVEALLGTAIRPQPESDPLYALVYAGRSGYTAMTRDISAVEWSTGFYNPAGMIAFHLESHSPDAVLGVLIHEATHAFMDRRVVRPGVTLPRWLGEGFAEYLEHSRICKGELVPGRTPRSQIYYTRDGATLGRSQIIYSVHEVRQAMARGRTMSLGRIVSADWRTFYGEERGMYYTLSWLLVHFLRHGRDGWAEREFPEFMLYVAEGYPVAEVFETVYGRSLDGFEREFRKYVQGF